MDIVLVRKEIALFEYVANVLIEGGANVYAINPPEIGSNKYLEEILMIKKEAGVDLLFSFDYYPEISLAAGALQVKYACAVTKNYDEKLYDNTVLNAWNYIFSDDSVKTEKLKSIGQKNVFLLPLPCTNEEIDGFDVFIKNDENNIDALYNKVSMLSPEIQGYLDGFMAIYRQDNKQNEVYKHCINTSKHNIREDKEGNNHPVPLIIEWRYDSGCVV